MSATSRLIHSPVHWNSFFNYQHTTIPLEISKVFLLKLVRIQKKKKTKNPQPHKNKQQTIRNHTSYFPLMSMKVPAALK